MAKKLTMEPESANSEKEHIRMQAIVKQKINSAGGQTWSNR